MNKAARGFESAFAKAMADKLSDPSVPNRTATREVPKDSSLFELA
jgi:hypothetical protein